MSINLNVSGNTQPLEAAVQAAVNRIRRNPIKITVDDKGATQPLGNMKRGADEFTKSMEAANARIIAFGASMAIINGVANAFKAVVKNVVEVEKSLADINVVMGLSAQKLDQFSDGLFKVAKETAASFDIAAAAATEYARQGLKVEETLKRTKDALILTRLTGMDSANAVKALTAAMNTYGDQIKDTTQLVSKFAAVDVQFAVSAEDFADAISRTGQAAKSAGVDIDELVGLVTAAQQQTARGGKVIGNSFKTIFTRIGRTDTLNQLENLGIAVRDLEGNTLGAKRILTDLANTFDHLTESQKSQIAQTVGGVFQINVLKAVLSDAAKQNGILANATQISAGATDEAIQKNEQLRNTMAAMASETGLALKEVSAQIGEIMLAPGMEKILNIVKSMTEGLGDMLGTGENAGSGFAKGFLKGLGNIITGPGLVVMVAVFTKLLVKAVQYASQSLNSLIGVTSEAQKQKAIQTSLVTLFGQNAALNKEMLRTDISRTEKEKIILGLLKAQVVEANVLNTIARSSASNLYKQGYGPNLSPRRGRADGHIPNFAHPERQQAAQGGYAAGSIRSMNIPGEGSVIYNSAEKVKNFKGLSQPAIIPPRSSKAGQNYQQAFASMHGFDPYAAGGYIPNFSYPPPVVTKGGVEMTAFQKAAASKQSINKGKASNLKAFGTNIHLNNVMGSASMDFGVLLGIGRDGGPVASKIPAAR
jgi:TP901 family phage tail tape measure protein